MADLTKYLEKIAAAWLNREPGETLEITLDSRKVTNAEMLCLQTQVTAETLRPTALTQGCSTCPEHQTHPVAHRLEIH